MHFSPSTAAALLALVPLASAAGTAYVVNNCGSDVPVFFAPVGQNVATPMAALSSSGYSQAYSNPGDGYSIKFSPDLALSQGVNQFEFTWASGNINYDISNINGNPFMAQGMSLVPSNSDPAYPSCVPVVCPAGQNPCTAAYNQPNDVRTMVCPDSVDLTFTLCPAASHKREEPAHNHMHRLHARQFR